MAKEQVEEVIKRAATEPEFYDKLAGARRAQEVLAHYDLTAEERSALLDRDSGTLEQMGVSRNLAQLADWCTGE